MPGHGRRDGEFGLSRALLYAWRRKGLIRTRTVKAPGTVRGVTFVDRRSVLALIEGGEPNDYPAEKKEEPNESLLSHEFHRPTFESPHRGCRQTGKTEIITS